MKQEATTLEKDSHIPNIGKSNIGLSNCEIELREAMQKMASVNETFYDEIHKVNELLVDAKIADEAKRDYAIKFQALLTLNAKNFLKIAHGDQK